MSAMASSAASRTFSSTDSRKMRDSGSRPSRKCSARSARSAAWRTISSLSCSPSRTSPKLRLQYTCDTADITAARTRASRWPPRCSSGRSTSYTWTAPSACARSEAAPGSSRFTVSSTQWSSARRAARANGAWSTRSTTM